MNSNADAWLLNIFSALTDSNTKKFSGLGLILYHTTLGLPILPLTQSERALPLPTNTLHESTDLLRKLCSFDSDFHDGFHLVEAHSLNITHVSQFFAPPIPNIIPALASDHSIGARFMAALLGSLLPEVAMTAILSRREGGIVFERGRMRSILAAGK